MPLKEVKETIVLLTDFPPAFISMLVLKLGVKEMEDRQLKCGGFFVEKN